MKSVIEKSWSDLPLAGPADRRAPERDAAETMRLTARGYHRVLRVARTLADLDGAEKLYVIAACPACRIGDPMSPCLGMQARNHSMVAA